MTATPQRASAVTLLAPRSADDRDPGLVGRVEHASPSIISVFAASTERAVAPAACIASIVDDADHRHVESHVLVRLRDLDDARRRRQPAGRRVRSPRRCPPSPRQRRPPCRLHRDRLPMSSAGNGVGDPVAEGEVVLLLVVWRARRQRAFAARAAARETRSNRAARCLRRAARRRRRRSARRCSAP